MALAQLLDPVAPAHFLEEHYLRLPFARPGGCHHLTHLGSWTMVEEILAQPHADVLLGREGQPFNGPSPTSAAQVRELVASGYTLRLRRIEQHHPQLAELARSFQEDFAAPVDVHLYCTPAGQPGFGWHYDAEDVFILQTWGSKEWLLRKNTVNPWPVLETLPADMRYQREIMPVLRCTLAAGDWLYIPAGYWHRTEAVEESISLSVGVLSATALDVHDFLRRQLLTSLKWRQRLPPAGTASSLSREELLARYRTLFTELGQDLADLLQQEQFARAFLAERERLYGPPAKVSPRPSGGEG